MGQSEDDAVLPVVDWSPFEEEDVYKLGLYENWPKLRQILEPVTNNKFGVTDAASQALVDGARVTLDCSWGDVKIGKRSWRDRYIVEIVVLHEGNDTEAAQVLELLLAAGVDPDKPGKNTWRPSHSCGWFGLLDFASSLFLCRPDMTAKNGKRDPPLQAAEKPTYSKDEAYPARKALNPFVAKFLKDTGFESPFPTLAELALRRKWFAVKNLLRRQVVHPSEFMETCHGKTAVEWAEVHGETVLAREIQYYEQPYASRMVKASKQMLQIMEENSSLKSKMARMEREMAEKEARIKELAETVEALSGSSSVAKSASKTVEP